MKSEEAHSWVWYVQDLLKRYHLPSAFHLLQCQPPKEQWRRAVKAAVLNQWESHLTTEANSKSTLAYVNLHVCSLSSPHPIWRLGAADPITVVKATTKAKMLVQRYPLFYSRTAGVNYGRVCPLCSGQQETMAHFLLSCPELEKERRPHKRRFEAALLEAQLQPPAEEDLYTASVLDPSHCCPVSASPYLNEQLESITRDWCFALHHRRSTHLGYPSRFQRANKTPNLLQVRPKI